MEAAPTAFDLASELTGPDDNEQTQEDSQNVGDGQENQDSDDQNQNDDQTDDDSQDDSEEDQNDEDGTDDEQTEKDSTDTTLEWESNGEKIRATQQELKEAFESKKSLQADYTQKTQNLARERQEAEARVQQEFQQVQTMSVELGQLSQIDARLKEYQTVDWDYLRTNDPLSYATYMAERNDLFNHRNAVANQIGTKAQQLEAQLKESREKAFKEQHEEAVTYLSTAIPGFTDPTKRKAILAQMKEFGTKSGFTSDELKQVADKRQLEVLYKAAQWDALQSKKPVVQQKVSQAPTKATKTSVPAQQQSKLQNNMKRLQKTGKTQDFAALLGSASK